MAALRVLLQAYHHLNHRGYLYIWANVLWFLLSLPIITAPAAWAGLVNVSRQAYLSPSASLDDFWAGFRMNFWRGTLMGVLNLIFILINIVNFSMYSSLSDPSVSVIRGVWWLALMIWFVPQFYMWPLLYELKQPALTGAFRNAALMTILNPVYTIILMVFVALTAAISAVLFPMWVLLTGSAFAIMATGAVLERLADAGLRNPVTRPEKGKFEDDFGGMDIE